MVSLLVPRIHLDILVLGDLFMMIHDTRAEELTNSANAANSGQGAASVTECEAQKTYVLLPCLDAKGEC